MWKKRNVKGTTEEKSTTTEEEGGKHGIGKVGKKRTEGEIGENGRRVK